jgi:hypothetical protein
MPAPSCPQRCSPMLQSPRRVPCTFNTSIRTLSMSATHIRCARLTREAGAQLPSALQPNAAISVPSAMHAQHEHDSHGECQPQARSQCTTALSKATPMLPSPSAVHAHQESDSRRVRQPPTRSQRPADLSAAAQCCHRRAECEHAQHKRGSHRTSLKREAGTHLPSALQPNAALTALSALHAQHVRGLHRAHQPQTRS